MVRPFRWGPALLNFLFPPSCYGCGALTPDHTTLLCAACQDRLVPVMPADPVLLLARSRLCDDGLCDDVVSLWQFAPDSPVQHLIHALKYSGMTGVGRITGAALGDALRMAGWGERIDLIVPLPLHRAKQRERGYNQAESIARGVGSILGRPVANRVVRRVRWTASQTTLGQEARQGNVRGAFGLTRRGMRVLEGKTVLLVDDVVTTAATTRACATALRAGRVRSIVVASIALAGQVP